MTTFVLSLVIHIALVNHNF